MAKAKTMSSTEFGRIRKALDAKARPFRMFGTKRKPGPGRPPSEHVTQHALAKSLKVNKRTVERYEKGELDIPVDVAERMRELVRAYSRKVAA
jgi:DNA-binding transcriptional regulator YiaG